MSLAICTLHRHCRLKQTSSDSDHRYRFNETAEDVVIEADTAEIVGEICDHESVLDGEIVLAGEKTKCTPQDAIQSEVSPEKDEWLHDTSGQGGDSNAGRGPRSYEKGGGFQDGSLQDEKGGLLRDSDTLLAGEDVVVVTSGEMQFGRATEPRGGRLGMRV